MCSNQMASDDSFEKVGFCTPHGIAHTQSLHVHNNRVVVAMHQAGPLAHTSTQQSNAPG